MQKLFLVLLFACPLLGQEHEPYLELYDPIETESINTLAATPESNPTKVTYFETSGANKWISLRAELDNGDIVTYTKMYTPPAATIACIYARKEQGNFETRHNATPEWIDFMEHYPNRAIPTSSLRR